MGLKIIYKGGQYQVLLNGVDVGSQISSIEFDPMKPDVPPRIRLELWASAMEFECGVKQHDDSKKD